MIKWKTIGKLLIAVISGKTITVNDPEQAEKIKEQIKDYNENPDPIKLQDIELEANSEKNAESKRIKGQIEANEKEAAQLEEVIVKQGGAKQRAAAYEALLKEGVNSEYFVLSEKGKLQLKDQPYDIPRPLALEFAERQYDGKSFSHLINFWKLLLLTVNDQARQDAFKYLTKQGMTITKQGYFLTFRRVWMKKEASPKKPIVESHSIPKKFLTESVAKVKRWKGSQKGYFIVQTDDTKEPFKLVRKDKLKAGTINLGSLYSFISDDGGAKVVANGADVKKIRHVYTDNHTKTFEIEIGVPVQMEREGTDQNHQVECSRGLHVGTPSYVTNNSWLGDKILACLVNPMHIVSVPYNDAHKMRVCEYLPIKEITAAEMNSFKDSDLSEFEYAYMAYEAVEMEKQLNAVRGQINILDEGLFDTFTKFQSVQDLDKLQQKIEALKQNAAELRISNDPVSTKLDLKHIESIIASRAIKVQ